MSTLWTVKVFIKLGIRLNFGVETLRGNANCGESHQTDTVQGTELALLAVNEIIEQASALKGSTKSVNIDQGESGQFTLLATFTAQRLDP